MALKLTRTSFLSLVTIGCSFKFPVKVGVEGSIVKCERTTDYGSGV
jgi:hypothetical protein